MSLLYLVKLVFNICFKEQFYPGLKSNTIQKFASTLFWNLANATDESNTNSWTLKSSSSVGERFMGALATHLLKPDVYPSFESLKSIYI